MAVFLGNHGNIRLRRGIDTPYGVLEDRIEPDDVNTSLNRLSFDGALDNLLTGDRIDLRTEDARGLVCFAASAWSSATVEPEISAYVHVNAVGGLRFFMTLQTPSTTTALLKSASLHLRALRWKSMSECAMLQPTFSAM
jgi:hypothetical protein